MLFFLLRRISCKENVSRGYIRFSHTSSGNIRNVGIMAHIDAGKTTTTERMLFYSGYSARVGEVHTGDTVMDYLDQERDRGITITSAAITFPWRQHQINLIDTPGHVDFTMEVERSMAVLDGGVVVLDGSAGVEAQTVTVWRQAERYSVPRIAYINKLDKPAASVANTVASIQRRLAVQPLVTQIVLGGEGKSFYGLVDLVTMEAHKWQLKDGNWGKSFTTFSEAEFKTSMFNTWKIAVEAREELIEAVTDFDSELAEHVIETESFGDVSESALKSALRRIALSPSSGALVTLLGSSYANVGVQPLMNAIVDYCPSPYDNSNVDVKKFGNNFCGLVFKIIHHPMKGVLCFVRVYTGILSNKDSVYNVNQKKTEKIGKLYIAFAGDFIEAGEVNAGNILVISGLKLAQTGDTLLLNKSVAAAIEAKVDADDATENAALVGPSVPDPVVFSSVEPPSLAEQKQFETALACLAREDPSLRVSVDEETGQTVLGGMGELHLEIVKDRMLSAYKVDVDLGKLQVAYREIPATQAKETVTFTRTLGDKQHTVTLELELEPLAGGGKPKVVFSNTKEAQESFSAIRPKQLRKITAGLISGLETGPLLSFPVLDCVVIVHKAEVGRGTVDTMVVAGSANIVRQLLAKAEVRLAEPVMVLEVSIEEEMVGKVVQDMVKRRGEILRTEGQGEGMVVHGHVPLAELTGYSREIRTMTSGRANIAMEVGHYETMSPYNQDRAIQEVTGFAR